MAWKPLSLSASAGAHLPALLISTEFMPTSFAVHLTDLTHIWTESLNRSEIVRRSREEGTSIDPSDGDQLKIFLEKLKVGLAGGKGTALALTINADPDRPSLVLNVSVDLPGGLAPLEWPVRLSAAPQSLMTSHLTIPLLQTQHAQMQEVTALAEMLKDKDHVILKLLDKLEEQGTELGQVWPQAAGKVGRKVDRRKAEEKVKGVARFDLDSWRKGLGHEPVQDIAQLIGEVFAEQTEVVAVGRSSLEDQEDWWDNIKGITVNLSSGKISTNWAKSKSNKPKSQATPAPKKLETQDDEDDAFQVQSTPPGLASTSKPPPSKATPSKSIDSGESTDDDDRLDIPSQHSKVPDSFPRSPPPPSPKPAKKLSAIGGGKKKAVPRSSPSPPPNIENDEESTADETVSHKSSPKTNKTDSPVPTPEIVAHRPSKKPLGKIGGKKRAPPPPEPEPEPESGPGLEHQLDSETEDEKAASISPPPRKHSTPPPDPQKPKKGKLGQIGGKKKAASPSSPPPTSTTPEAGSSTNAAPKRKLGAIGGHKKAKEKESQEVKAEVDSQEGRGRASVQPEKDKTKTPEPRETSLERADRKREALKRELEAKAKAPVKKKRKF